MAPGLGTRGWDQQALLFRCFACARQRWQSAASRATFLGASESNVRQWRLALGHAVGTSRPCCFAVSHAPGKGGSRQLPELLLVRASESDVRHWGPLPGGHAVRPSRALLFRCFACARQRWQSAASRATFLRTSESGAWPWDTRLGPAGPAVSLFRMRLAKAGRRQLLELLLVRASESDVRHWGPLPGGHAVRPSRALLFRCCACARQRWQPAASRASFLRASESNVRQWRLALGHAVGTSRPCCFAVSHAPGKGGSRQLPELLF